MLRLLLVAFVLFAVGCASEASGEIPESGPTGDVEVQSNETTEAAEPALAADVDTTGPARVDIAGETVPTRGVVTDMQSGDVSCYLTIRTDAGTSETVHADYSVCDSNAILDRRVQIEYAPGDVIADSCNGDPECLDSKTVALAIVAQPIDG